MKKELKDSERRIEELEELASWRLTDKVILVRIVCTVHLLSVYPSFKHVLWHML